MKPIELTTKHKAKLLEMCKKLFPEDVFSFDNDLEQDGFLDRNMAIFVSDKRFLQWKDEGSHFHWYEFCITHLAYKVFLCVTEGQTYKSATLPYELLLTIDGGFEDDYTDWCINLFKLHPVDYLYEEFKKIV